MVELGVKCSLYSIQNVWNVPSVEDVAALAHPVLRHRMALKFSAPAGLTLAGVIDRLVERIG